MEHASIYVAWVSFPPSNNTWSWSMALTDKRVLILGPLSSQEKEIDTKADIALYV